MNRSPLPTQDLPSSLSTKNKYGWLGDSERRLPTDLCDERMSHCTFAPVHYESGYAYPLIVWLHGPKSNEQELLDVMPLISVRNYVGIAPRGTDRAVLDQGEVAFDWDQSSLATAEALARVSLCVDMAQERFHIHPERIFIAGYCGGGTMALRLVLAYPDQFAGAISLGGPMPKGDSPLRRVNEARKLPLLLSVSPDPENYSLEQAMGDVKLLHSAGASLELRLYPEGVRLATNMLSDADKWIMERVCPAPAAPVSY